MEEQAQGFQNETPESQPPQEMPKQEEAQSSSSQGLEYAGFWLRFLAMVIDGIILFLLGFLVGAGSVEGSTFSVNYTGWRIIIPIAYVLVFWIALGATPGKLAVGVRIVEANGKKLTWTKALLRFVGSIISSIILFIGFIWIGFDKRKQGIHDKIAKTFVVKKRSLSKK